MTDDPSPRAARRQAAPLDQARLEELALAYVARFSTSAGKLEAYLQRKLRERGWDGQGRPDAATLVARFVGLGYVNDEAFARARSQGLLRRGYGPARIAGALREARIGEDLRQAVAASPGAARAAALALARRRGFGPFGAAPPDRARREKQIAALVRAGHCLDNAIALVDARSAAEATQWAEGLDDAQQ